MTTKWLEARPKYRVKDNAFNRANYPGLIGKEYYNPPLGVEVEFINRK